MIVTEYATGDTLLEPAGILPKGILNRLIEVMFVSRMDIPANIFSAVAVAHHFLR